MRLVAAIGGGVQSARVLRCATCVAGLFGAELQAAHVGEADAGRAARVAQAHGVPLQQLDGAVATALDELAAAPDVAGLVVGMGTPTAEDRPVGEIALALMAKLPGVLVLVPEDGHASYDIRRVLVALDGTAETALALERVVGTLGPDGVEVIPLHVIEPGAAPPYADQPHHWSAAFAEEFAARHPWTRTGAGTELRAGDPAARVVDAITELHPDLVALAWHQRLVPGHAAVVRRTLTECAVPLLLVPVGPGA
jgi:hypothetical protein